MHWRDAAARLAALAQRWRMLRWRQRPAPPSLLPQLVLYKWITGAWLVNAYATHNMGFSLASPHVADTLFSTQKGLFFWSPVLLLSVAGVFVATGRARALVAPAVVVFAIQTLLIATWSQWQFGATFGHRGYTDGFALAAPLMAAFFEWSAKHRRAMPAIAVTAAAAVALSIAQMIQYWIGVLPMADTTWAQYTDLFLRFR